MSSALTVKGDGDAGADAKRSDMWNDDKLKLIEYSLDRFRNDTFNIRNNKYLQKEQKEAADHTGFEASIDGFDAVSSVDASSSSSEDIIGSGSEDEKFVIKGGLKAADNGLNRIEKIINDANKDCDSASDDLKSRNILGIAWDSTVNFLKHPWNSTHSKSHDSIDNKMETNNSVNLTKNTTSSAWTNSTNFVPGVADTAGNPNHELVSDIFERVGTTNPGNQNLTATDADVRYVDMTI